MIKIKNLVKEGNRELLYFCLPKSGIVNVKSRKAYLRTVSKRWFRKFMAFDKETPVAQVECVPIEHAPFPIKGEQAIFINCMWISKEYRNQDIGQKLLEMCINEYKKYNPQGISLVALDDWLPWLQVSQFMKLGFMIADTKPTGIKYTGIKQQFEGREINAYLLFKPLSEEATWPQFIEGQKIRTKFCPGYPYLYEE
ncbi:MAG: GNAT family N-acetyltransferase [Thermoprotei archaeon]